VELPIVFVTDVPLREELEMVRENKDEPGTDAGSKDGWAVLHRLAVYIDSFKEEIEEEGKLATDPMSRLVEMEKLLVLTKCQRFLTHELTLERQEIIKTLEQDLRNASK
jgi:hypothetical protein